MDTPNAEDWTVVGDNLTSMMNDMREQLGIPLLVRVGPPRLPTKEELQQWEDYFPGMRDRLCKLAENQMRRRKLEEKLRRTTWRIYVIAGGMVLFIILWVILLYFFAGDLP
jgi:uncharacterized membrane protein